MKCVAGCRLSRTQQSDGGDDGAVGYLYPDAEQRCNNETLTPSKQSGLYDALSLLFLLFSLEQTGLTGTGQ